MKKNILSMAVLLMASAAVFTACSSDDNITSEQPANPTGKYTMTINASKGGDATTRALSLEGKTLNATWATTENVYVKKGNTWATGSLQPVADGATATLKGTLSDVTITANNVLTLQFPKSGTPNYTGQVGTLADIAANFDYATATVTVDNVDGSGNITVNEPATFTNLQSVVKFTLKDKNGETLLNAGTVRVQATAYGFSEIFSTEFNIPDDTYTTNDDGIIYLAIPTSPLSNLASTSGNSLDAIKSNCKLNITATVGSDTYTYTKNGWPFEDGKYYDITVKMTKQATVPEGAINGKFSVSDSKQVYFSKGNLQATWDGSSWNWHFAANQWDYIGDAAGNISINGNGTVSASDVTVDLFGWVGASNTTWSGDLGTTGNAAMHGISNNAMDVGNTNGTNGYGNNASEALKSDWGTTINDGYTWFTLSKDEWTYLFNTRITGGTVFGTAQARYAYATINTDGTGVNGMILFPDGVDIASTEVTTAGTVNNTSDYATKCTTAQWAALAAKGCVFLPAAGYREKASVYSVGFYWYGYYWSSSPYIYNHAFSSYCVRFDPSQLRLDYYGYRYHGSSVRLVRQVE